MIMTIIIHDRSQKKCDSLGYSVNEASDNFLLYFGGRILEYLDMYVNYLIYDRCTYITIYFSPVWRRRNKV